MACCLSPSGEPLPLLVNFGKCLMQDHTEYEFVVLAPSQVEWTLTRRYREFHHLHEQLSKQYHSELAGINFPPKRAIHNTSTSFIFQRQQALQGYMRDLLKVFYGLQIPQVLVEFLEWDKYEIHGITSSLARRCYQHGSQILQQGYPFQFSVFEVYAINARMKSAAPTNIYDDPASDFGHLMDFVHCLQSVKIHCPYQKCYRRSNIVFNQLNIDLSCFKSLIRLELMSVVLKHVDGFIHLKKSVMSLIVRDSLTNVKSLMLGDLYAIGHGDWVFGSDKVSTTAWEKATLVDLSHNDLCDLDPSIALLANVEELNLAHNRLVNASHLACLSRLSRLNLSNNRLFILERSLEQQRENIQVDNLLNKEGTPVESIDRPGKVVVSTPSVRVASDITPLHTRLGNITHLWLDNNRLKSAALIDRLFSLRLLDLSYNQISSFVDIMSIASLHCLEKLMLHHNPIALETEYRFHVFDIVGSRMEEVELDGQVASGQELQEIRARRLQKMSRTQSFGASLSTASRDTRSLSAASEFHCIIHLLPSQLPYLMADKSESSQLPLSSSSASHQKLRFHDNVLLRNFLQHSMFSIVGRHHSLLHYIPVLWQYSRHFASCSKDDQRDLVVGGSIREETVNEQEDVTLSLLVCSAQQPVIMLCRMTRVLSQCPDTTLESINSSDESATSWKRNSEELEIEASLSASFVTSNDQSEKEAFRVEPHHIISASSIQQLIVSRTNDGSGYVRMDQIEENTVESSNGHCHLERDLSLNSDVCHISDNVTLDWLINYLLHYGQPSPSPRRVEDSAEVPKDEFIDPRLCQIDPEERLKRLQQFLMSVNQENMRIDQSTMTSLKYERSDLRIVFCRSALFQFDIGLVSIFTIVLTVPSRHSSLHSQSYTEQCNSKVILWVVNEKHLSEPPPQWTYGNFHIKSLHNSQPIRAKQRSNTRRSRRSSQPRRKANTISQSVADYRPLEDSSPPFVCLGRYAAADIHLVRARSSHSNFFHHLDPRGSHHSSQEHPKGPPASNFPAFRHEIILLHRPSLKISTKARPQESTLRFAFKSKSECTEFLNHLYSDHVEIPSPSLSVLHITPSNSSQHPSYEYNSSQTSTCEDKSSSVHDYSVNCNTLFALSTESDRLSPHLQDCVSPPLNDTINSLSCNERAPNMQRLAESPTLSIQYNQTLQAYQNDSVHDSPLQKIRFLPFKEISSQLLRNSGENTVLRLCIWCHIVHSVEDSSGSILTECDPHDSSSSTDSYLRPQRLCLIGVLSDGRLCVVIDKGDELKQRIVGTGNQSSFDVDGISSVKSEDTNASSDDWSEVANFATEVDRDLLLHGQTSGGCSIREGEEMNDGIWNKIRMIWLPIKEQCNLLRQAYLSMFHTWIRLVFVTSASSNLIIQPAVCTSSGEHSWLQYLTIIPNSSEVTQQLWRELRFLCRLNDVEDDSEEGGGDPQTNIEVGKDMSLSPIFQDDSTFELNELLHHIRIKIYLQQLPKPLYFCILNSFTVSPSDGNTNNPFLASLANSHISRRRHHSLCPLYVCCFIILEKHICLVQLDVVHYPLLFDLDSLPKYIPPKHPSVNLLIAQPLSFLHEVTTSSFDPYQVMLSFQLPSIHRGPQASQSYSRNNDESEIVFDPTYYSCDQRGHLRQQLDRSDERECVHVNLELAHIIDKQGLIRVLRKRFSERFGRELQIILN